MSGRCNPVVTFSPDGFALYVRYLIPKSWLQACGPPWKLRKAKLYGTWVGFKNYGRIVNLLAMATLWFGLRIVLVHAGKSQMIGWRGRDTGWSGPGLGPR